MSVYYFRHRQRLAGEGHFLLRCDEPLPLRRGRRALEGRSSRYKGSTEANVLIVYTSIFSCSP